MAKKPKLVEQPHGGALLSGGKPGNRGGIGQIRNRVREAAALSFEKRLPILEEIADDQDANHAERIKAVLGIGQMGVGRVTESKSTLDHEKIRTIAHVTQTWLEEHGFTITDEMGTELAERWASALEGG